jgi:hypothetical protein
VLLYLSCFIVVLVPVIILLHGMFWPKIVHGIHNYKMKNNVSYKAQYNKRTKDEEKRRKTEEKERKRQWDEELDNSLPFRISKKNLKKAFYLA